MKTLRILIFCISLLVSFSLFAQNSQTNIFREALMPGGPLQGQALDVDKMRGLVLLNTENNILPQKLSPHFYYIANVQFQDRLYIARIHKKAPQSLDFIYEKFTDIPGGHADLVYHMAKDQALALIYEIQNSSNEKGYTLKKLDQPILLEEIVFTAEALRAIGDSSPLMEGGMNAMFAIVYRLSSVPDRLFKPVLNEGRVTSVFDIPFNEEQVQKSFIQTIKQSSDLGMSTNYDLITNNCITSAINGALNGLNSEEKKQILEESNLIISKLKLLSRTEVNDQQIISLLNEYRSILNKHSIHITPIPIQEKEFFNKWLRMQRLD